MAIESTDDVSDWTSLLDFRHFERSVNVMQILDSFLHPAPVMFSSLPKDLAEYFVHISFNRVVLIQFYVSSS